jgi:hypothetical protein
LPILSRRELTNSPGDNIPYGYIGNFPVSFQGKRAFWTFLAPGF